ncbi:MAG: SUMF1/EgtB/PvdO family nonheme iron enzyme [Candidatus Schekmanbacteria bacterium]|nr:SUMF1/EgtB/PvdO family nonheme iron enzyme [Candidatus Schekmanbacteria bacterium]
MPVRRHPAPTRATALPLTLPARTAALLAFAFLAATAFAATAVLTSAATAAPPPPEDSPVGTNLLFLTDWIEEWPFVDAFKTSRPWVAGERWGCWDCAGPLDLDDAGWVRSLDAGHPNGGQVAHTLQFWDGNGRHPAGTYVVLYDGEGTLEYAGGATRDEAASSPGRDVLSMDPAAGGLQMTITATNPANYLRNIRILMPGGACASDPFTACNDSSDCPSGACTPFSESYATQPFHPTFLRNLSQYKAIRFLNWMELYDENLVSYSSYPTLQTARWQAAPAEIIAELGNQLGADIWITVPFKAADDFVRELATRLRDRLAGDHRVYVEYSNEVWNPGYPFSLAQAWAAAQGCALYADLQASGCDQDQTAGNGVYCEGHPWPQWSDACDDARQRYYSHRSAEIWELFAEVFGGRTRLVRVLASQNGNTWMHERLLSWENTFQKVDAFAIAAYFGYEYGTNTAVSGWTVDQLLGDIDSTEISAGFTTLEEQAQFLSAGYPGLQLVAYEGGQHLVGVGELLDDASMEALFHAANRDVRMGEVYRRWFAGWRDRGGTLFMHFTNAGGWSKYGSWGALEHQDQGASPKYDAITQFIDENPCWWSGCGALQAAVAITRAESTPEGVALEWDVDEAIAVAQQTLERRSTPSVPAGPVALWAASGVLLLLVSRCRRVASASGIGAALLASAAAYAYAAWAVELPAASRSYTDATAELGESYDYRVTVNGRADASEWVTVRHSAGATPTPTATTPSPTAAATLTPTPTLDPGTMAQIPAGEFMMGSEYCCEEEQPVHPVYLNAYAIDLYAVTNAQYAAWLNASGTNHASGCTDASGTPGRACNKVRNEDDYEQWYSRISAEGSIYTVQAGYENHPVVTVFWEGAYTYCAAQGRRLPTEAEWEKAARGTDQRKYPWGNEEPDCTYANFQPGPPYVMCVGETLPVDTLEKGRSPYGLYHLAANSMEWVSDWYDAGYYAVSPYLNPTGPASGPGHVQRSDDFSSAPSWNGLRTARRNLHADLTHVHDAGFRCALSR